MKNPYESPSVPADKQNPAPGQAVVSRRPVSLCFLLVLFSWTVLMAFINLVQEDSESRGGLELASILFCVILAGFSGLSQVPGLVIGMWRWKGSRNSVLPMLLASYIIALTGVAGFTVFALQTEPSDSMNSAAHMHIFLFPLLHFVFSLIIYVVAFLLTMGCVVYSRFGLRGRDPRVREEIHDDLR
ncbi:MAG: hypothetical protein ACR2N1_04290 [Rubripirellula sp.]